MILSAVQERASGMYQVSSFYWARMLSDIPIDCSLPSVLIVLVYWMGGLRSTASAFFSNWAAIILLLLVAQSFGLVIGALVSSLAECFAMLNACSVFALHEILTRTCTNSKQQACCQFCSVQLCQVFGAKLSVIAGRSDLHHMFLTCNNHAF